MEEKQRCYIKPGDLIQDNHGRIGVLIKKYKEYVFADHSQCQITQVLFRGTEKPQMILSLNLKKISG